MNICRITSKRNLIAAVVIYPAALLFAHVSAMWAQPSQQSESSVLRFYDAAQAKPDVLNKEYTVEVGDSSKAEFDPSFRITVWRGECEFNVNLSTADHPMTSASRSVTSLNDKPRVRLSTSALTHDMFAKSVGEFEWQIVLAGEPDTNVFTYSIETSGLKFFYQDTLSDEEKAGKAHRPDSVVGSYAVYHATKANNRRITRGKDTIYENYQTGKAFHIFRPKAWDAATDTAWCDLAIDTETGRLSIAVPSAFLDHAVYPVVIDPTFGYAGEGGTAGTIGANYRLLVDYWLDETPGAATTDTGRIYIKRTGIGTSRFKIHVYDKAVSLADCDWTDSSEVKTFINTSAEWVAADMNGSLAASTKYIVGFQGYEDNVTISVYYDAGTFGDSKWLADTDWNAPATLSGASNASPRYSVYVVYTTAEGESQGRRRTLLLGNTDNQGEQDGAFYTYLRPVDMLLF